METRRIICHIYLALGSFALINVLAVLAASEARGQSAFWVAIFLPALLFILIPAIVLVRTNAGESPGANTEREEWRRFLASDSSIRYLPAEDKERLFKEFQQHAPESSDP